jgi:hypothetical protein
MPKHKYIESPERMWELFKEYESETKRTPFLVHDFVGKDAHDVRRERERPLTIEGFSVWLYENEVTSNIHDYFANTRDAYNEYSSICRTIRERIRRDQIEGGMAGIYNPSITQRLNGLTENTKTEVTGNINTSNVDYSKLSKQALEEIAALENESES